MKSHKSTMTLWLIIGLLGTGCSLLYLSVDFKDITKSLSAGDTFIFVYGLGITCSTIYLSYQFKIEGDIQTNKSIHQTIGGFIPSKKLNALVSKHFLKRGGVITRTDNFVSKTEDTQRLLEVIQTCKVNEKIAKQEFICTITHNGTTYEALSASKEMAICIAFLKSCGETLD